jgi:glycosyltransferase 2 family protein
MSENNPSRQGRVPALRLIGTLGAVVLLVYLLSKQGWSEILAAVGQISWQLFLFAFLLTLLSRMAVVSRWHVLLHSAGVNIPYKHSTSITFAGLFASNFLPTTVGGDVVRLAGAIRLKYDSAICLASLVVDRLVGMVSMAMAVPFGVPSLLAGPALKFGGHAGIGTLSAAVSLSGKLKIWWDKGIQMVHRLIDALAIWLKHPAGLLAAVGFSWVRMLCEFTIVWTLLGGMGQHISFWLVAGLWSFTYFVTLLPISINGYGVQELILIFLFTHNGGVSQAIGVTLALLMRSLQLLASLPGALFVPGIVAGEGRKDRS